MAKHSPRSVLKERYSQKFCRAHWKTTVCRSVFHNAGAGCMDSQTFTFTFYLEQVFSSEICEIFKNPFENTNNSAEHLRTGARAQCYLEIVDFVIISDQSRLRVFVKQVKNFYDSEVHSLLIPFSKESMKVKKVSKLNLLDTCATLIHVSRTI